MPSTTSVSPGALPAPPLDLPPARAGQGPAARQPSGGAVRLLSARVSAGPAVAVKAAPAKVTAAKPKVTAAKVTAAKPKTATTKTATTSSGYATTGLPAAYSFLRDPKLSVDEKLLRFTMQVSKETDDEVQRRMEAMAGGTPKAGTTTSPATTSTKKKGFSLWGLAKAVLPPLGLASSIVGDATVKKLVQQVSGPALAAAATALGMPALAPVALKAGSALGDMVTTGDVDAGVASKLGLTGLLGDAAPATGTSGGSSSTGATSSGSAPSAEDRQQELMLLQHAMDKQKEMTSLISNMLRSMHDARMGVISNLR